MVSTLDYDVVGVEADYGRASGLSIIALPRTRWPKLCCCYHREKTFTLRNYVYHAASGVFVSIGFNAKTHDPVISQFYVSLQEMRANLCAQLPSDVIV